MQYEAERGYLILGTESYIECAVTLAKSLRYWHPKVKICLLTDVECDNSVFDFVKQLPWPTQEAGQTTGKCITLVRFTKQ